MPGLPPEQVATQAQAIRQSMTTGTPEHSAAMTRQTDESMITSPANVEREFAVNSKSDRATVADAMYQLLISDLRPALAKIKAPVLEIGTWIAYKQYGVTHDRMLAAYSGQFTTLPAAKVIMSDDAKHFVMLDSPDWLYKQLDAFLKPATAT
jgi:pimeloyl-ACP methyl ester carboxylesterase